MTKRSILGTTATLALCLAAAPAMAETLLVTTFEAAGEGSLQAALSAAARSAEATVIVVTDGDGRIETPDGLTYSGASALRLVGNGVTVASAQNVTLLSIEGPMDVALDGLRFEGPGGWSIENRGDADGPAGKGIFLDVGEDAEGVVRLHLSDVQVSGVASHGIHISDCTLADECGSGGGGAGEGSPASISIQAVNVRIEDVGHGRFDSDGLRVDERGEGDISLTGMFLSAVNVGADGVELDEGQAGNVSIDLISSSFLNNGAYCNPVLLESFLPEADEGEFDEGAMAADAIPGPISGSPDDACFEREVELYDDGSVEEYAFGIDVDDGFDVDEAGPGSLFGTFSLGDMSGNLDEGYDFDEEDAGDIDVVFTGVTGTGNSDDALKLSEAGAGNVYLVATAVEFTGNGGLGIVAEEENDGDLSATLVGIATSGNDGGDLGVEAVQEDDGTGIVYVIDSEIADGIETEGAEIDPD